MRNSYGSQFFAGTELAERNLEMIELERLDPRLSERVGAGLDLRTVYQQEFLLDEITGSQAGLGGFFQMQGDIYLDFKLDERFRVAFDKGLRSGYEVYGLAAVLPLHGSLRVGRFTPSFGWRSVDHNVFTREMTGFGLTGVDTGLEFEFHPRHWSFSLSLGNGTSALLDGDTGAALTGRAAWQNSLGRIALSLGASAHHNEVPGSRNRDVLGAFAGLHLEPFTWLGEADLARDARDGLAVSQQVGWQLRRGLELLYSYDFWDGDLDQASGHRTRHRLSLDYIPYPFFALQPGAALYYEGETDGRERLIIDLQFYFFM